MTDALSGENTVRSLPAALFMGDFNVGKSSLINALLRREVLLAMREESRALPTFLVRSPQREARYAALHRETHAVDAKSHEDFLQIRREPQQVQPYSALGAALPGSPFARMALVDTGGLSTDDLVSVRVTPLEEREQALLVVVADIEYWSAKHTMDFIAAHQETFGESILVAANKADLLNANEIRRIRDKAHTRMEKYGIAPAPRFLALSARLESARGLPHSEHRRRVKPEVRELCDADFDAFRVALYEFESRQDVPTPCRSFSHLLQSPMAASFIQIQEGSVQ